MHDEHHHHDDECCCDEETGCGCGCENKEYALELLNIALEHGAIKFAPGHNQKNVEELVKLFQTIFMGLNDCICDSCCCDVEYVVEDEEPEPKKKDKKKGKK